MKIFCYAVIIKEYTYHEMLHIYLLYICVGINKLCFDTMNYVYTIRYDL